MVNNKPNDSACDSTSDHQYGQMIIITNNDIKRFFPLCYYYDMFVVFHINHLQYNIILVQRMEWYVENEGEKYH